MRPDRAAKPGRRDSGHRCAPAGMPDMHTACRDLVDLTLDTEVMVRAFFRERRLADNRTRISQGAAWKGEDAYGETGSASSCGMPSVPLPDKPTASGWSGRLGADTSHNARDPPTVCCASDSRPGSHFPAMNVGILILRLLLAGHACQKLLGWFCGGGPAGLAASLSRLAAGAADWLATLEINPLAVCDGRFAAVDCLGLVRSNPGLFRQLPGRRHPAPQASSRRLWPGLIGGAGAQHGRARTRTERAARVR